MAPPAAPPRPAPAAPAAPKAARTSMINLKERLQRSRVLAPPPAPPLELEMHFPPVDAVYTPERPSPAPVEPAVSWPEVRGERRWPLLGLLLLVALGLGAFGLSRGGGHGRRTAVHAGVSR